MTSKGGEALQITKVCPACGRALVVRRNGLNGSEFLGCAGFVERDREGQPRCTHTEPLPEYVLMLRAGAAMLPGLD